MWPFSTGKMGVQTLDIGHATLARNRVVWRILRQNRCARPGCSLSREPKKVAESLFAEGREITHAHRIETPKLITFCMVVDVPDIITYRNFGDRRLRGFWVAVVKFPLLIDFRRRPYNTVALPCECVMTWNDRLWWQRKNEWFWRLHISSVPTVTKKLFYCRQTARHAIAIKILSSAAQL